MSEPIGVSEAATGRLARVVEQFLTPRRSPATPRDDEIQSRGNLITLACGLSATSWGEGPTALLAHGWESRGTHWRAFVPALVEAGFRAVAVDAPAHGHSPGERANVLQYGLSLVAVGVEIGPLAGVVGHSFGAGAVAVALHRGLEANRAALISGPSSLTRVVERYGRHRQLPEADIDAFVRLVEREVGEPLESLDITRIAVGLTCPVLIVHDRGDDEMPVEDALAVASAWPGAKTLITERYGHRRILIAREVVQAVIAFFQTTPSPHALFPGANHGPA